MILDLSPPRLPLVSHTSRGLENCWLGIKSLLPGRMNTLDSLSLDAGHDLPYKHRNCCLFRFGTCLFQSIESLYSPPDCSKQNFVVLHPMNSTVLPVPASNNIDFILASAYSLHIFSYLLRRGARRRRNTGKDVERILCRKS